MLVQPSKLDDPVLRLIRRELEVRRVGPGDKLPAERDLAVRLGLGRSAVRRALALLERQGQITRHVGRGTFLTSRVETRSDLRPETNPAEIMAVRLLIEPQMVRLVVASAGPTDFEAMQRCLAMGEAA